MPITPKRAHPAVCKRQHALEPPCEHPRREVDLRRDVAVEVLRQGDKTAFVGEQRVTLGAELVDACLLDSQYAELVFAP